MNRRVLSPLIVNNLNVLAILLITLVFLSCNIDHRKKSESIEKEVSKIETVQIGNQVWMTKNLNVSTFINGDPIPKAKTKSEWKAARDNETAAWCIYRNVAKNGIKYGKLYNWFAVNDPRGIAPKGFHVPNDQEWSELIEYLGGDIIAGKKMKSTEGWKITGNGTNESRFNALPGGCRDGYANYDGVGKTGGWWSSTEKNFKGGLIKLNGKKHAINKRRSCVQYYGWSVRCIKN